VSSSSPPTVNLRPPLSPFMSRQEVADFLRIHPNSVDKLARDGVLRRHRILGLKSLLYLRDEVKGIVVEDEDPNSAYARRRARRQAAS
jgi:hypothetical protein